MHTNATMHTQTAMPNACWVNVWEWVNIVGIGIQEIFNAYIAAICIHRPGLDSVCARVACIAAHSPSKLLHSFALLGTFGVHISLNNNDDNNPHAHFCHDQPQFVFCMFFPFSLRGCLQLTKTAFQQHKHKTVYTPYFVHLANRSHRSYNPIEGFVFRMVVGWSTVRNFVSIAFFCCCCLSYPKDPNIKW